MIVLIAVGLLAFLLVASALAPLEALGWWAGWRGGRVEPPAEPGAAPTAEHYLVYLSGIGAIAGNSIVPAEARFLDALQGRLAGTALVRDVFPYSVTNTGLNGERLFAWLWQRMERFRLRRTGTLPGLLVNLRNVFQVAVSADQRYGPIFNYGVAQEILAGLRRAGYPETRRVPVTLLGWSGGAQIAVGACPFLVRALEAPVQVVSLGGVMDADPGLERVRHLWHLRGTRDRVERLGTLLFPGRWHVSAGSSWNRARSEGRVREIDVGPMEHMAPRNYFDDHSRLPDGASYAERTLDMVVEVLREGGVGVR